MPGSSRTVPDVAASADTVPLPDSIPPRDDDRPEALEPPRRRRRWLRIAVPVVVLLLVIGAAELAIRLIVPGIVSSVVRENLSLSEEHPVEVRLGAFELPSVLTGRLSTVEVEVDDAQLIDGLTGTVRLRADSVPFAVSEGEIRGASASLMIGKDELPAAIGLFTAGVADGGVVSGASSWSPARSPCSARTSGSRRRSGSRSRTAMWSSSRARSGPPASTSARIDCASSRAALSTAC
ncbi:LmeA family phospholipid-binding protein [Leucobacter soli]|uniref:LmeA family phospholipid-binding protein n=1 Tax=Leucobacter soli TaxID=2812850 RepID=UPI003617D705